MYSRDFHDDDYADFEARFDPLRTDRKARRKRNPAAQRKQPAAIPATERLNADQPALGIRTSYVPGLFEEGWLLDALQDFFQQSLILDILSSVKGGKEANVYRCEAHPATGHELLAAKVYRPRMFRNLRNDAMYREGRTVLAGAGRPVKATDQRIMRALGKKTAFGQQVAHTSWLLHEFTALKTLYEAGVSVPHPIAVAENAILMEFIGDADYAAPPLESVALEPDEAEEVFAQVIDDIEIMLRHGLIHGDLSAYNLLYWEGRAVIIDFPQVTNSVSNSRASAILRRDIQRVCEYFADQGVRRNPAALHDHLWKRLGEKPAAWTAADLSRFEEE